MRARLFGLTPFAAFVFLVATVIAQTPGSLATKARAPETPQVAATNPKAASTRVAVIDLAAVERAAGGETDESFTAKQTPPISEKWEQIRTVETRLLKEADTLSSDEKFALQQDVKRMRAELDQSQHAAFAAVEALRSGRDASLAQAISRTAAALGYQVVLSKKEAAVVWTDASVDITAAVVAALKLQAR
jgi:Skp family chaperone for outer membrane proteins